MAKKKTGIIILGLFIALAIVAAAVIIYILNNQNAEKEPELYSYPITDYFVTNVKDSSKLFKTSIVLVVNEKGMETLLDEKKPEIRDTILFVLRGLTAEDLTSDSIQDKLRDEIPKDINEALEIDNVVSLYFTDFVMQ